MTYEELTGILIDKPDETSYESARKRWDGIAKPIDGLGFFEETVCRIAGMMRSLRPDICDRTLIIMCADNGVVKENVTQTGSEVTRDVAALMGERKSSVGIMAGTYPVRMIPVDIGIDCTDPIDGVLDKKVARGTRNMACEEAMSRQECLKAIETGIDLVRECQKDGTGIIATGEMGIGNTTTSTALLCALTGADPGRITGKGAGLSDEGLAHKKEVIRRALDLHSLTVSGVETQDSRDRAFKALCSVGGLDIAGLAGVFIGGAMCHIPVVTDGFISAVAALCASRMVPGCEDYMIASHSGKESGTSIALDILGLKPVIYADMALGEGTGAIMLFPLLDMAINLYMSGTAFGDTGIDGYERL